MIKRSEFLNLLEDYPDDLEKFCNLKDNIIINKSLKNINSFCFSCGAPDHLLSNCPKVHFYPRPEKIIA